MGNILNVLAASLAERGEGPNIELAAQVVSNNDHQAISTLVSGLKNKNKSIQSDAIKVLYEIGSRKPEWIEAYVPDFVECVNSKNPRLVWGGMTALVCLVLNRPEEIYSHIKVLKDKAMQSGVMARDNFVYILTQINLMCNLGLRLIQ